jgi:hypothetical protein
MFVSRTERDEVGCASHGTCLQRQETAVTRPIVRHRRAARAEDPRCADGAECGKGAVSPWLEPFKATFSVVRPCARAIRPSRRIKSCIGLSWPRLPSRAPTSSSAYSPTRTSTSRRPSHASPLSPHSTMLLVGIIEIAAALIVAVRPYGQIRGAPGCSTDNLSHSQFPGARNASWAGNHERHHHDYAIYLRIRR